MLRFLADENLNGRILRGLQRRVPELDVVRDGHAAGYPKRLAELDATVTSYAARRFGEERA